MPLRRPLSTQHGAPEAPAAGVAGARGAFGGRGPGWAAPGAQTWPCSLQDSPCSGRNSPAGAGLGDHWGRSHWSCYRHPSLVQFNRLSWSLLSCADHSEFVKAHTFFPSCLILCLFTTNCPFMILHSWVVPSYASPPIAVGIARSFTFYCCPEKKLAAVKFQVNLQFRRNRNLYLVQ